DYYCSVWDSSLNIVSF
nr:immunoglobulin light chain junction region [Macaca mulatta]MOW60970.1 immunoglobulin light chain junction region [Macaca mulatta]